MRLFVALVPPPAARAELDAVVAPLRDPSRRWTSPAGWHLTLAFLGEIDEPEPVTAALAPVAAAHAPFDLRMRGAGRFGDRVLWAGIDGDLPALDALAGAVRDATGIGGEFRPHLTLAYGHRLEPLVRALSDAEGPTWPAADLHLMESRPGARYTAVAGWPLGRRG